MTTRTISNDIVFSRPFILDGLDATQAAGTYIVDTEQELIETTSFPIWRRIGTAIRIVNTGITQHLPVDPDKLHEALVRDGSQQDCRLSLSSTAPRSNARSAAHAKW